MSWNRTHHTSSSSGDHKGIGQTLTVHNHTGGDQHHSSPSSSLSHASKLFDSNKSHQLSPAVVNSSTKDSLLVFLTLAFISVTLYFTFFLWKKHREKPLATLYKLEEYRYSRLSQNEMEVDNVIFYGDALQADASQQSDEDEECKPATLQVETDSLISISNGKTNITLPCTTDPSATAITNNRNLHVQAPKQVSSMQSSAILMSAHGSLLQDSDEDLLQ